MVTISYIQFLNKSITLLLFFPFGFEYLAKTLLRLIFNRTNEFITYSGKL